MARGSRERLRPFGPPKVESWASRQRAAAGIPSASSCAPSAVRPQRSTWASCSWSPSSSPPSRRRPVGAQIRERHHAGLQDRRRGMRVRSRRAPPRRHDGDGDGVSDERRARGRDRPGRARLRRRRPAPTAWTRSPSAGDADGDGLLDAEELALGSDPDEADSDGDGVSDGEEFANGTDPAQGVAAADRGERAAAVGARRDERGGVERVLRRDPRRGQPGRLGGLPLRQPVLGRHARRGGQPASCWRSSRRA